MKRAVLVFGVASLAACSPTNSASGDDYPIQTGSAGSAGGGGGGGGGGSNSDAGTDALTGDAGVAVNGRVCLLTDLRMIGVASACSPTKAGNLVVTIGNRTAVTSATGAFSIIAPSSSGLVWTVTGDGKSQNTAIYASIMPYGTDATIPAISIDDYNHLAEQNSLVLAGEQQGSLFVRVLSNGAAAQGVTATSSPAVQQGALYDTGSAVTWSGDSVTGTGTYGTVWFAGIQTTQGGTTAATVTLQPSGTGTKPVSVSATVADQAITFVTYELQ